MEKSDVDHHDVVVDKEGLERDDQIIDRISGNGTTISNILRE